MSNPITLSTMAGLAIAGAGLGLYLGNSAVSEIDPVHYSSPFSSSAFHADLAANRPDLDSAPRLTETAGFASGLGSGCVGCRTYPEEYHPIYEPAVDAYDSSYAAGSSPTAFRTDPAEIVLAEADERVAEAPSRIEIERIVRYAHYRVSEDEGEEEARAADNKARPVFVEIVSAKRAEGSAKGVEGLDGCAAGTQCEDAAAPGI